MPFDGSEFYADDPILKIIDRVDELICDEEHWGIGTCGRTLPRPIDKTLAGGRHCPITALQAVGSHDYSNISAFGYLQKATEMKGFQSIPKYNNADNRTFLEIKVLINKARELRLADIMETADA